jgi:hypothetical protein
LFCLMHHLILWHAQGVCVFNGINLILINNFSYFFNGIPIHLAKMVLYLQFRRSVLLKQRKMEVVLILPINAIEVKLFLSEDALSKDTLLTHHLKLVRWVHL